MPERLSNQILLVLIIHFYTHVFREIIILYFIPIRFFCKKDNTFIALIFWFFSIWDPHNHSLSKSKPAVHWHLRRDQKVLSPCSLKSAYPSKMLELTLQKRVYSLHFHLYEFTKWKFIKISLQSHMEAIVELLITTGISLLQGFVRRLHSFPSTLFIFGED